MRFSCIGLLLLACSGAAAIPAGAQQSRAHLAAEQPGIGQVETHLQKFEQALGVVSRLRRELGAETECNGICYFPSASQSIAWRCAPTAMCDLHCNVKPPAGGCQ